MNFILLMNLPMILRHVIYVFFCSRIHYNEQFLLIHLSCCASDYFFLLSLPPEYDSWQKRQTFNKNLKFLINLTK